MNLRQWQHAVRSGAYVLEIGGTLEADSEFQRARLTEAVSMARLYLCGDTNSRKIGQNLGLTDERIAQMIRLGIKTLLAENRLRPAKESAVEGKNAIERPSQ